MYMPKYLMKKKVFMFPSLVLPIVLLLLLLQLSNASSQERKNAYMLNNITNLASENRTHVNSKIILENFTGSIPILPTLRKALRQEMQVSLSNASTIAENSVGENSTASVAMINAETGFLVYVVFVTDEENVAHRVTVDAGNGTVLSSEKTSDNEFIAALPGITEPPVLETELTESRTIQPRLTNPGITETPEKIGPD
jgi:hypothetical protein